MTAAEGVSLGDRVVVIDDDDLFRESLEQNLEAAGYPVFGFRDPCAAVEVLVSHHAAGPGAEAPPRCILLDWKMPGMSGIEVLKQLRDRGLDVPVIFLTVLGEQIYEEAALAGGAVDFVEKSRSFAIVLRRMELILEGVKAQRNAAPDGGVGPQQSTIRDGALELDLETSRASWKGIRVALSLTEFRFIEYLVGRRGKDVGYRELYDLVHGEGFMAGEGEEGFRANVRTFIKRIRAKFREIDGEFDMIENYPGFGYRWRGEGEGGNGH